MSIQTLNHAETQQVAGALSIAIDASPVLATAVTLNPNGVAPLVTGLLGGLTGGLNLGGLTGGTAGGLNLGGLTGLLGGATGGLNLGAVTGLLSSVTGLLGGLKLGA